MKARENFEPRLVTITKESGKTVKKMGKEKKLIKMELSVQESSLMENLFNLVPNMQKKGWRINKIRRMKRIK